MTGLLWFNGTSEKISDTAHLFSGISSGRKIIVPGWATSELREAVKPFHKTSRFSHEAWDIWLAANGLPEGWLPRLHGYFDSIIEKMDSIKTSRWVIGGFSRGSAAMLPIFLKRLVHSETTTRERLQDLFLVVVDPVTGSSGPTEATASTLKKEQVSSGAEKAGLVRQILDSKPESTIYGVILHCAYESRVVHFSPDVSWLDAFGDMRGEDRFSYYANHIGFTHSSLSLWSAVKEFSSQAERAELQPGDWKTLTGPFRSAVGQMAPDLKITKLLLDFLVMGSAGKHDVCFNILRWKGIRDCFLTRYGNSDFEVRYPFDGYEGIGYYMIDEVDYRMSRNQRAYNIFYTEDTLELNLLPLLDEWRPQLEGRPFEATNDVRIDLDETVSVFVFGRSVVKVDTKTNAVLAMIELEPRGDIFWKINTCFLLDSNRLCLYSREVPQDGCRIIRLEDFRDVTERAADIESFIPALGLDEFSEFKKADAIVWNQSSYTYLFKDQRYLKAVHLQESGAQVKELTEWDESLPARTPFTSVSCFEDDATRHYRFYAGGSFIPFSYTY